MNTQKETDTEDPSKVAALLDSLNAGDVMRESDAELAKLLDAVENTGKKGSLTITLAIERKRPGQVVIRPKVASKIPKEEPLGDLRYINAKGELQHNDPSQAEMSFMNTIPMSKAVEAN